MGVVIGVDGMTPFGSYYRNHFGRTADQILSDRYMKYGNAHILTELYDGVTERNSGIRAIVASLETLDQNTINTFVYIPTVIVDIILGYSGYPSR
jgi:hypothetical protein